MVTHAPPEYSGGRRSTTFVYGLRVSLNEASDTLQRFLKKRALRGVAEPDVPGSSLAERRTRYHRHLLFRQKSLCLLDIVHPR